MAANVTPVTLTITDFEVREVLSINYHFNQETDIEGQITGIPRGGEIVVRVKALNNGNNQLIQWMLAPTDPRDVSIAFQNTVDGKTMKIIKGTGCSCIKYKECWEDGEMHYEEIHIICQVLDNGGVKYENLWK